MSVVTFDPTTGKFTVSLGGVVYTNCTTDADCPGRAQCFLNATFLSAPSMCACSFSSDLEGAQCQTAGPEGWFYYGANILAAFISFCSLAVGIYDLYLSCKWNRFKMDALTTSLIFSVLGLFFTGLETSASTRLIVEVIPPNAEGSKADTDPIDTITTIFSFWFSTLAMMNVSLVWIEIANNANKMRRSTSNSLWGFRRLLLGYYVLFLGLILFSLAQDNYGFAAYAAVPGVLFVIVTYVVGFYKMRKMLKMYLLNDSVVKTAHQEANQKMRDSLKAIQRTAIGVSFCAFMYIIWLGIWVGLGGFVNEPGFQFNLAASAVAWTFVSIANSLVLFYLHSAIIRKCKAEGSSSAANIVVGKDKASETPSHIFSTGEVGNKSGNAGDISFTGSALKN
jgi:hypothetical protein